jgi:hypothetical protein
MRLKLSTDRPKGTINSTTWDDGECALPARVARAEKCATPQHGRKKILACWRPMISFGACFQHEARKMRRHDWRISARTASKQPRFEPAVLTEVVMQGCHLGHVE